MRLIQDHDVEAAEFCLMQPKRFANNSLDPVSAAGFPAVFSRNRKTEPGEIGFIVPAQYRETLVAASKGLFEDTAEGRRRQQPMLSRKPIRVSAIQAFELRPADVWTAMIRYGVRRARPLARRRLSTSRPALVAIRARKPWVRARFSLLGW